MPHPPNMLNVIRVVRGQTKVLRVTIKDQDGRPAPLNMATDIVMTVRDHNSQIVIVRRLNDGIEIEDASKGKAKITLSSVNTSISVAQYKYDLWVVYEGTPPVRDPVVKSADLHVTESVTSFE